MSRVFVLVVLMLSFNVCYALYPETGPVYWPSQFQRFPNEDGYKWDADYKSCVDKVFPYIDSLPWVKGGVDNFGESLGLDGIDVQKEFQRLYAECMREKGHKYVQF